MTTKLDEYGNLNLLATINDYYEKKERVPKKRDYFHVSEIMRSKKELYESLNGKSKKFPARVKRILENGNYMHERYIKIFAEIGLLVASEITAVENDLVHGRLDCILTDKKRNYIVDMKSISMWGYNSLDKPKTDHNMQLQFYMYYMNIPQGFILYENKNDQMIKCYFVELDTELVEAKIKELEQLKKDIMEDKLIFEEKKVEIMKKDIKVEELIPI